MAWLHEFRLRVKAVLHRRQLDRDLQEELEFHLAMREQNSSPTRARRQFGNVALWRETCRDLWTFTWLETIAQDLRYGLRMLRRSPAFTTVAVLSLGLGIGANTAIFGLIDAVLLKFLPVEDPARLVKFEDNHSYPAYRFYCDHNPAFSGIIAATQPMPASVIVDRDAEEAQVELVSGNALEVLGVGSTAGRTFGALDDVTPGGHPVAMISDGYWQRRFARDPRVVGRTIRIHQSPFVIVGVTRPGFTGVTVGASTDVWTPLTMQAQVIPGRDWLFRPNTNWLAVIARVKPGFAMPQARAAMEPFWRQYELERAQTVGAPRSYLDRIREARFELLPASRGLSRLRGKFERPLWILMAIAGLILLLACANLANLLLARSSARRQEIGARMALGAGRFRLVRQLLTESLLLCAIGGLAGLLFSQWSNSVLLRLASAEAAPLPLHLGPDARLLGFALVISLFSCLLFGLAPALRVTKMDVGASFGSHGGDSQAYSANMGRVLIAVQVALSLLLVISSGLFMRTLENLRSIDMGFVPDQLLVIDVDPTVLGYKGEGYAALCRRLLDRLAVLPGVKSVSLSQNGVFLGRNSNTTIAVEGFTPPNPGELLADYDIVGPNYFATMGVPLVLGRDFTTEDLAASRPVVVVNQSMAKAYFPGRNPIGNWIIRDRIRYEIIGVCSDMKDGGPRRKTPQQMYFPYVAGTGIPFSIRLLVRTTADPVRTTVLVRQAVHAEDSALPVPLLESVTTLLERTLVQERMIAMLSVFFGGLALLLAAVGLYGVIAYTVARRTREIGIRIALGALRGDVVWLVLYEMLATVSVGVALGVAAAVAAGRYIASLLYGLTPADPATFAGAISVLLATSALAAIFPAMRAACVDPMVALRHE